MRVLVVDGANVVGSVPDGWWRDRPGAAARLHEALRVADLPFDLVELVLEGRARDGVPVGRVVGASDTGAALVLVTVHAVGVGDDEIAARCELHVRAGHAVTLATADRGLLARVAPFGVGTLGPRLLRRR